MLYMYTITTNVNDLVKIRISTVMRNGYVRYANIQAGNYTEAELIEAFNTATCHDSWIVANDEEPTYCDEMRYQHENVDKFCKLTHKDNMLIFESSDIPNHGFYFIHCPNSFTNCPFFTNVVTLYSSDYRSMRCVDAKNNFCKMKNSFPDSNSMVIKNPTSSTVSLTWGSNVVSIDPLGYYPITNDFEMLNRIAINPLTISSGGGGVKS